MSTTVRARLNAVAVLTGVSLVWLGLLLGVSFLSTPVKFLAPSLSLPVALDVGRQTFYWFSRVELVVAVTALIAALAAEHGRAAAGVPREAGAGHVLSSLVAALLILVIAQLAWLLPLLDARVEIILSGGVPPPSSFHDVYILLESLKLGVVGLVSWLALRRTMRGAAHV